MYLYGISKRLETRMYHVDGIVICFRDERLSLISAEKIQPTTRAISFLYSYFRNTTQNNIVVNSTKKFTKFIKVWKEANVFNLVQDINERI
jgi:hypothetical protein